MSNKIKLLQTAKEIYERGDIKLSSSDRKRIEDETQELLKRSMTSRAAAKAPKGFDAVLAELKTSQGADEAFQIVARYMQAEGMLDKDMDMELGGKPDFEKPEKPDFGGKPDFEKPEKPEMGDKPEKPEKGFGGADKGKPGGGLSEAVEKVQDALETAVKALDKVEDLAGDKPGKDKPEKSEKPEEDKKPEKEDKDEEKEEKEPVEKAKDEVVKMAQEMLAPPKDGPKKLDRGPGKGLDKGKSTPFDISKLKKEKEVKDDALLDKDEMGMDTSLPVSPTTAPGMRASVRVAITKENNIAVYGPRGPMFIAVPNASIKKDAEKLRRTANKVYGLVIYEGPKAAAEKCGATLLAGADSDILTDSEYKVPENTKGVSDNRETDTRDKFDQKSKTVLEGQDTDTEDKKEKVTAIKKRLEERRAQRKPARFEVVKRADSVLDSAEDAAGGPDVVSPDALDSGKDGTTDTQDDIQTEPKKMLEGGDVDYKGVEASYKKLYAARAVKQTKTAVENFIHRFSRCMAIAAQRMVLNHDDDPLKAAAADVLTADNVRFASGERYNPMDERTAKELIELIAAEGHQEFVDHLLNRAADLMEKSDGYLKDVEADLKNLKPVDPKVDEDFKEADAGCDAPKKAKALRRQASAGNFEFNPNAVPSKEPVSALRNAMGLTKVGRVVSGLQKAVAGR